MKKIHIGLLFGGRSAEHEVSIHSARNILQALDKNKYDVTLIGIDKFGNWQFGEKAQALLSQEFPKLHTSPQPTQTPVLHIQDTMSLIPQQQTIRDLDVIFPILHGPYGEDGTVQGLLKLAGIAFVGSDVLGSAIGMDKDVMKRLLREAGIPIVPYLSIPKHKRDSLSYKEVVDTLGIPFFVKPANLGSSVGVHKIHNASEFADAITDAFSYDRKILIEKGLAAREIECAVLGNDEPVASIPGEIIPTHEFYSYESKYLDENGASIEIPARLSESQVNYIQDLAIKSFETLACNGLARVDFFLEKETEKIYVNEINTLPGFTNISMYPKLWEHSGIPYTDLIDQLIELAIENHKEVQQLKAAL